MSPLLKWVVVRQLPKLSTAGELQESLQESSRILLTLSLLPPCLLSPAVPSQEKPTCQDLQCTFQQQCQVVDEQAKCVEMPVATCRAQGDPHYTTFDGRRYDMMGTCLYTMVELCSEDETLPAFSVEAKNEHRGSRRVSYVGLVNVRAYSHVISLVRGEVGLARVSIQKLQV